jgi:membrane protease subunit HflC
MRTNVVIAVIVIVAICFFAYYNSKYTLTDDDQVVVTQFSKVVDSKDVPGEYFKIPFIQKVHFLTKKYYLTEWEQQIPTSDRKFISLNTKAFWKITDPVQYYKKLNSYQLSQNFVIDNVGAVEREFIVAHPLSKLVGEVDKTELKDAECNHSVALLFKEKARDSILQGGISLNNVEARVTTPIKMIKP